MLVDLIVVLPIDGEIAQALAQTTAPNTAQVKEVQLALNQQLLPSTPK
jgi:hypothetical protein